MQLKDATMVVHFMEMIMLDTGKIEATFETLFQQAKESPSSYMRAAKHEIDEFFGDGYAAANPVLVAAYMQAAATEFAASTCARVQQTAVEGIAYRLDELTAAIRDMKE
jgi:hypothetical protein